MLRSTFVVAILAVMSLLACQKQQSQSGATANTGAQGRTEQSSPWKMTLTTEPDPPAYGENATLRVTLTDLSGSPVSGADVRADLKMQIMDMGKNELTLAAKGAGAYEGKGQFTMAGPWNVVVTAAKDGKTGQQTFQIVAKK